jgi:hypothetical protein
MDGSPVGPSADRPSCVAHKICLLTRGRRQSLHADHLLDCRGIVADMGRGEVEVGRDWHGARGGDGGFLNGGGRAVGSVCGQVWGSDRRLTITVCHTHEHTDSRLLGLIRRACVIIA